MQRQTSLILKTKIFKILNQTVPFSDVSSGIMHLISFPNMRCLFISSKAFFPSFESTIPWLEKVLPFPALLATAIFCNYVS